MEPEWIVELRLVQEFVDTKIVFDNPAKSYCGRFRMKKCVSHISFHTLGINSSKSRADTCFSKTARSSRGASKASCAEGLGTAISKLFGQISYPLMRDMSPSFYTVSGPHAVLKSSAMSTRVSTCWR